MAPFLPNSFNSFPFVLHLSNGHKTNIKRAVKGCIARLNLDDDIEITEDVLKN